MEIKLENITETFVKELCKEPNIKEAFVREGIIEETIEKQTAVELLEEKLKTIIPINLMNDVVLQDSILQAKEMEKQQIIDAKKNNIIIYENYEQYFNETYKK
jgi:hypothetical protein